MSTEIYLPRQYLPQVPESATVNTGEQGEIEVIRDEFFEKVYEQFVKSLKGKQVADVKRVASEYLRGNFYKRMPLSISPSV